MVSVDYLFEPIDHDTVVDSVTEQIEGLILAGVLKEGTKLPSERDISERMGVSRPKVREALKRLEDSNLIAIRHGEGSFIAPLISAAMSPALINLISRNQTAFYDYLEYRRVQEGFAARLAAERATKLDLERLEAILVNLREAQTNGDDIASKKNDIAFHLAIVDAGHNAMLIHMMSSIYELTQKGVFYNREFLRSIDGTGEQLLEQHEEIGRAIFTRNGAKAEEAAHRHIDFVETSFRLGQDQQRRELISSKLFALQRGEE